MTRSGTPLHRFQYFYTPAVGGSKPSAPTSICDVQRHILGDCKRAGCRQVPSVPTGVAGAGANDRRGSRTATRPSTAPPHHVWAMRRRCAAGGPGRASVTPKYSAGRASEHGAARPSARRRRTRAASVRRPRARGSPEAERHRIGPLDCASTVSVSRPTAQAYLDLCRDHDRLAKLTSFYAPQRAEVSHDARLDVAAIRMQAFLLASRTGPGPPRSRPPSAPARPMRRGTAYRVYSNPLRPFRPSSNPPVPPVPGQCAQGRRCRRCRRRRLRRRCRRTLPPVTAPRRRRRPAGAQQ